MSRLIRIRHRDNMPHGTRAFTWPLDNGTIIVYVSSRLSALQQRSAARLALRKTGVPQRKLILLPLLGLPLAKPRKIAASVTAFAVAAGAITWLTFGGHPYRPPARTPRHVQPSAPAPRNSRSERSQPRIPSAPPVSASRQPQGNTAHAALSRPQTPRPTGQPVPAPAPTSEPVPTPEPQPSPVPTPARHGGSCVLRLALGRLARVCLKDVQQVRVLDKPAELLER